MFKHSIIDQFYEWISNENISMYIQYSNKKWLAIKYNSNIYLILIDNINITNIKYKLNINEAKNIIKILLNISTISI